MHEPVIGRLEEYLGGNGPIAEVEEHLKSCAECRREVEGMKLQSALFQSLRAPREIDPPPAFYARVMQQIEIQAKPSVWSVFGESIFAKRLAYASATALLLMGSLLYTSSTEQTPLAAEAPEYILAGEVNPTPVSMDDAERGRDVVLATLATYEQAAE